MRLPRSRQHVLRPPFTAWKRYAAFAILGASLAWFSVPGAAQNNNTFKTRLAPTPRDGRNSADIQGLGEATATLSGTRLSINASFDGLASPATGAQLRQSVAAGVHGDSIADLTVTKQNKGTVTGSVNLTAAQVTALREHKLYIRIDSQSAGDGNLWGWLF